MRSTTIVACALAALLGPAALMAQVETSTSIRGLVADPTGAAVPAATVVVRNTGTNEERTASTDATGFYAFPSLVPGTYDVTVSHPGFKTEVVKDRVAVASQSAQVDVKLTVGQTSESVTVTASGAELITTTSAEVGGTIDSKLVDNLPLNGRDFFDLAAVLPMVSTQNMGNQLTSASKSMNLTFGLAQNNAQWRSSGIFAAGNSDSATNVSIDGMNVQSSIYGQATPQQPPDAIEEMRVHVSGMNAEFGNGVAAVNIITKSGTNQFHGTVYEYVRNDVFDANNFFNNLAGRGKSPLRQNQFGASGGGPAIKNKLFFFAGYEGERVAQSTLDTSVTPPPVALRDGDFSTFRPPAVGGRQQPIPIVYNPFSYNAATGLRTPFPGNIIPKSAFDPVTANFLQNWVEIPNSTVSGQARYTGSSQQTLASDQGLMRVDWTKSANTRIYGRMGKTVSPSTNQSVESLSSTAQNTRDMNATAHWTQIISANTVSDFMIGYAQPYWQGGRNLSNPNVAAEIGLVNTSGLGGPPFFNTGYSMNGLAGGGPSMGGTDNIYQTGFDITHIRDRHSLKFGVQAVERRLYYVSNTNDKGTFVFNTTFTAACPDGNPACTAALASAGGNLGGNAFASYLLGLPASATMQLNGAPFNGHRRYYGGYAQDSWRVSGKLTLNYGMRYEYWSPWNLARHTVASFNLVTGQIQYVLQHPVDYLDPATGFGRNAPLNSNIPSTGYSQGALNFAPRTGLAYAFTPSTVFRAGYGIYFDGNTQTGPFSGITSSVGPFRQAYSGIATTNEQVPSLRVNGLFPIPGPTAIPAPNDNPLDTFSFVMPYYPLPTVQEWSAGIQQRIGKSWSAEVSYQGTHAVHQLQQVDVNPAALPQGALASVPIVQRRKFPFWGPVNTYEPIGYSRYEAGAVSVRNTRWHGLTLISSFTFAKNLASYNTVSTIGNQDVDVAYMWRGPAHLTPQMRFTNFWSYELPLARRNRWLGGWIVSGTTDMSTGIPNFVTTTDSSGTGYGTMPNRICDANNVPGGRSRQQWFNNACFVQPAFGTWGNANLGVFTDPGANTWNISLRKSMRLRFPTESSRIDFRADAFNAFNHTQWGPAVNSIAQSGNVNAGTISSTRPPRIMQFSLRYMF